MHLVPKVNHYRLLMRPRQHDILLVWRNDRALVHHGMGPQDEQVKPSRHVLHLVRLGEVILDKLINIDNIPRK